MAGATAVPASGEGPSATAAKKRHGAADAPQVEVKDRGILIIAVMLAALLQVLDGTIANVALPHMEAALGATTESITWVLTSYIVASGIALPLTGWLSGRFGRRQLMIASCALFIMFSALCGIANSLTAMVLFRIGQGISGAFIMPLSQSIMLDVTRPSKHPQTMAIWGAGVVIGPILGPIVGGWLTENLNWRWVFYVNVPLGLIALTLLIGKLPHWDRVKERFDIIGFSLIALTLGALQLLLDRGEHIDWFDSGEAWAYAITLACCGWMAIVHLSSCEQPLFDRRLFRDRNFIAAFLIMLAVGVGVFATLALLPPMLQNLMGFDVLSTGFVLAPRGVGVLISMQVAGYLVRKGLDSRILIALGFAITALSLFEMSAWSLDVDSFHIISTGITQGLGLGLIFIPLNVVAFATLPAALRTEASSLMNLARSIGAAIGISVVVSLLARNIQINHAEIGGHVTPSALSSLDISLLRRFGAYGESGMRLIDAELNRQAAMIAYLNDYYLMGWICVVFMPIVLIIRKPGSVRNIPPDPGH